MKKLKDRHSFAAYFFTCILIVFTLFFLTSHKQNTNKPTDRDNVPYYELDTTANVVYAQLAATLEGQYS